MKSAKDEMLARMPPSAGGEPPPVWLEYSTCAREQLVERFVKEAQLLGAKPFLAADAGAARCYLAQLAGEKGGEVIVARRPAVTALGLNGPHMHEQGSFPAEDAAVSITEADYALADTGTLVVFSAEGEGRTLSLLAPVNATVLPASRIVTGLIELFAREPEAAARSSAMVFITGPSRTADIELTLTVGVHGPGELHVVVLCG